MYLSILALPILGALTAGLLGRKLGVTGAHIITCSTLTLSAFLTLLAFYEVGLCGSSVHVVLSSWIDSESMLVNWGFLFDSLTVSMLLPVLVVSSLVHIFSVDYIAADPHQQRFFAYLSIFTFFMLVLVTGDNYLVMFLGWEGIGVSSYLLVGFWFTRIQANKSAIKAMTVNRVGDIFLSVGFFALFWLFGNLDYSTVFSLSLFINETALTLAGLLLLLAAIGKSAQLGLHTWLPDAMEGPTPVSALIHAATLVTAGVYLLLRSSPLLEYAPTTLIVITWVGALTAFFAATTGLLQNDIKRVIAYSTCSQIGYLFIAVGLSQYNVALFHLVNHAFFKALLFLAAGGVLHSMQDQQDLRKLGGLIQFLPFTYTAILVGSLSLMAFPFITGFFSKDLILEIAYGQYEFSGNAAYWLGTVTAIITAFYSFRLISLTFLTVPNGPKRDYEHTHEQPFIVMVPYVLLSLLAIFFGFIAKDLFVGPGSDFLSSALFIHPNHITLVEAEFSIPLFYKLLPAVGSFMGAGLALFLYHKLPYISVCYLTEVEKDAMDSNEHNWSTVSSSAEKGYELKKSSTGLQHHKENNHQQSTLSTSLTPEANMKRSHIVFTEQLTEHSSVTSVHGPRSALAVSNPHLLKVNLNKMSYAMYSFFNGKYFFDAVYNHYIINGSLALGLITSKVLDRGFIEKIGPFGLTDIFSNSSRQMALLDTGVVTSYALYIILGFITLTLLLFAPFLSNLILFTEVTSESLGYYQSEFSNSVIYSEQIKLIFLFAAAFLFI